jgi:photosystem II stability/assembly factor-like uncharacterized protein
MSADGKYQTACVYNEYIYRSDNYGDTWAASTNLSKKWRSIAMSADGMYQTAVAEDGTTWNSSDYGQNWPDQKTDSTKNFFRIAMSS